MKTPHRFSLCSFLLFLVASFALSCGNGAGANRQLQSIALTPATADAQAYPDGQVQFTATGDYNTAPNTVTPLAAHWGTCYQGSATSEISVTAAGLAQCTSGASGAYTVWADDPASPNGGCLSINACGGGCFIVGTAQLTCP
jgi:hypothetical protein